MSRSTTLLFFSFGLMLTIAACKEAPVDENGETGSPDLVGSVCVTPDDCYPDIDATQLLGEVECLDRVPAGYCTHQCTTDADCCAIDGECVTDLPQVCSPFESTGLMMCFLSCEAEDVAAAGATDENAFCQEFVSPWFGCRCSCPRFQPTTCRDPPAPAGTPGTPRRGGQPIGRGFPQGRSAGRHDGRRTCRRPLLQLRLG